MTEIEIKTKELLQAFHSGFDWALEPKTPAERWGRVRMLKDALGKYEDKLWAELQAQAEIEGNSFKLKVEVPAL